MNVVAVGLSKKRLRAILDSFSPVIEDPSGRLEASVDAAMVRATPTVSTAG
jgi:hypothetical protein